MSEQNGTAGSETPAGTTLTEAAAGATPTPETQTGTQSPEGTSPTEPVSLLGGEPKPVEAVPFDAEKFEWPTDLEVTDDVKGKLAETAKAHGITDGGMKAFVALHSELMTKAVDGLKSGQTDEWNTQVNEMAAATKTHYGANMEATVTACEKVLDEFGSVDLRKQLILTGLGNNLAMFQFLEKVGKAIAEPKPIVGNAGQAQPHPLAKIYPTMFKDQ